MLVLASQVDLNLPEHGYVRVTYKEALHDPESTDSTAQLWHPVISDGKGGRVTDPKGLFFINKDVVIDVSHQQASVEVWKHGDIGDAEGLQKKETWSKKRVMHDILTHRMPSFTQEQQDQWRALSDFHESFRCSDMVPQLPLNLRAGAM